jgi:hypothetical protein
LLLRAALTYARRGIPVFPCEPGGKAPLTYSGFWDATTDARRVKTWWNRWPYANVGVPTGERSGLLVLDVDPRDGGLESLAALELINGSLPRTAKTRTGGGGVHVFFRSPAREEVRNSAGRLGPGLDVRGEGGYVVVPPSRTQSAYKWLDRTSPADPTWLLECLKPSRLRQAKKGYSNRFCGPISGARPLAEATIAAPTRRAGLRRAPPLNT